MRRFSSHLYYSNTVTSDQRWYRAVYLVITGGEMLLTPESKQTLPSAPLRQNTSQDLSYTNSQKVMIIHKNCIVIKCPHKCSYSSSERRALSGTESLWGYDFLWEQTLPSTGFRETTQKLSALLPKKNSACRTKKGPFYVALHICSM